MPRKILKTIARHASPWAKSIEGYSKIRTAYKKSKMITSVAEQNVRKKYPRGGREGMQEMLVKERRALVKKLKANKATKR